MNIENSSENGIFSLIIKSCTFFMILSFLLCVSTSIVLESTINFPNVVANLIVIGASILLSIITNIIKARQKKAFLNAKLYTLYLASIVYLFLYIFYYIFAIFNQEIRSIYSIISILGACLVFSLVEIYVPLKNHLLKSIIYFIVFAIPYFISTLLIANYGKGNNFFVVFAIYFIVYSIIYITYYLIHQCIRKQNNENKEYKQMFK